MLFVAYRLICQLAFTVFMFGKILIIKKKKKAYQRNWLRFRSRYFYFRKISFYVWPTFSHVIPFIFPSHWFHYLQRVFVTLNVCFFFEKTIKVMLYCSCRMPWKKSDNNVADRQMTECNGCRGWYHRMCERLPTAIFQEKSKDWHCFQCIANENV